MRPLLWTAAAAALPVLVTVLVLTAVTLGVLVFSASGFDSLFPVVAVEWLVVNRVPLTVDHVALGFLPLLPPLLYAAMLARQTRVVLADVDQPGPRESAAAMAGVTVTGVLVTVLASFVVGSASSDFAVRETGLAAAVLWTAVVGLFGSGLGVWLYFRRDLREVLPLWVRGGLHLGAAFAAATWAVAALLVTVGLVAAWGPVGEVLGIGKGVVGTLALTAISVGYLPNVVFSAATLAVGGEAHLGEASYSVFAVSRGPMPEVPLAAALPTTDPHWVVQGLLLLTVLVAAGLARAVAHWFRSTADAVKATWLAALIVAAVIAVTPVVAGGELGVLGTVGTGSLIAAGMALLLFGVIGSVTIALSLAGLTRRRERAQSDLDRRRRRAGLAGEDDDEGAPVAAAVPVAEDADATDEPDDADEPEQAAEPEDVDSHTAVGTEADSDDEVESDSEPEPEPEGAEQDAPVQETASDTDTAEAEAESEADPGEPGDPR